MPTKQKQFKPSQAAENQFMSALKKVARVSGHMVEAHVEGSKIVANAELQKALKDYSKLIDPWARRQAAKMLAAVSKSNRNAYQRAANIRVSEKNAKQLGRTLKQSTAQSDVGQVAALLMNEQVALIKSIPIRAGERAQKLALEAVYNGSRASEIAEELMRSTKVSESTATLIARTEVARSNASFTQARAVAVGSTGYIWRTTMDGAERHSHALMNGKYVEYSKPPTLSDGTTGHAGTFPNCRCYQDVQFDDPE